MRPPFPGFRFHPTDVELVMYHLKKKLEGKKLKNNPVTEVNIYEFSPWDLPDKSNSSNGDLVWFFFCSKSKKYSSGSRMNRATEDGYWKATGKDRPVQYKQKTVAMIKTLVFHLGHPPEGQRTDWVMHEYRMEDEDLANAGVVKDAYVLCKLFEKSGAGPKNGAQYGAPFNEEEWDDEEVSCLESSAVFGLSGATKTPNPSSANDSAVTNMTLTEPGPSTITSSANETGVTSICGGLTEPFNNNENTQEEVANSKGKNVMEEEEEEEEEEDGIFKDLPSLSNLEEDAFNMFCVDQSDYAIDKFPADDLDDDLQKFFVG